VSGCLQVLIFLVECSALTSLIILLLLLLLLLLSTLPVLQDQAELLAVGCEYELVREAGEVSLEAVRNVLRKLPPHDWVSAHVRVTGMATVTVATTTTATLLDQGLA
jgi:hypothetical protein